MQTAVTINPVIGSPGDIADFHTATDADIKSAVNTEATDGIVLGTMVKRDDTERSALRISATADKAVAHGIAVRGHYYSGPSQIDQVTIDDAVLDAFMPGTCFGVGRTGDYVVVIEEDVDVGDAVRVRAVAGVTEIAGAFRTSADSTDCLLLPSDAFFWVRGGAVDADTGWGVAVLHVDFNSIGRAVADV